MSEWQLVDDDGTVVLSLPLTDVAVSDEAAAQKVLELLNK